MSTKGKPVTDTPAVEFESRMLIDGKLVEGQAGTVHQYQPRHRRSAGRGLRRLPRLTCIAPSTRPGGPSTRPTGRPTGRSASSAFGNCRRALEGEQEALREELILEVGCPRMVTHGPQLDLPLADALTYPADLIETYPLGRRAGRRHGRADRPGEHPEGLA